MGNISGALSLIALFIPGFLLNNLVLGKKRTWESLALSWITGSALFTLCLFVGNNLFDIRLNQLNSWIIFVSLTLLLFIPNIKKFRLPEKIKLSKYEKLTIAVIFLLLALAFITSFFFPVADWDAITVFNFRAKAILEVGQINIKYSSTNISSYPFYTTLMHFWIYLNGLWTAIPIYTLFTTSFATGIFFAAKRILSSKISLLLAIACIFTPRIFANSFIAYTNLPYTVLLILGATYIYLWTKEKNYRDLILGVLLSGATFWVRSFPFALINFSLILLAFPFFRKISKYLTLASVLVVISLIIIPVFSKISGYLMWSVYKYYSPFWIIFAGLLVYNFKHKKTDWFWTLLYIGYGLVLFAGTFVLIGRNPDYYFGIPDAVQRMTMFLSLVVIWFLAETAD